MFLHDYVGGADVLERVGLELESPPLPNQDALVRRLDELSGMPTCEPRLTFVVDTRGWLRLALRRSEHVVCAGGGPVLSAGEIEFEDLEVVEVTNQSTGFCPRICSWGAVAAALERVGVVAPDHWTQAFVFRRCPACGQRNIVRDAWFACAVCEEALPREYNF